MPIPLSQHYYGLCERNGSEAFWAEPLNALTSIGFLIAAAMLYRYYRGREELHGIWRIDIVVLIGLIVAIGFASFNFHTQPSGISETIDITVIIVFIILYFWSAMFRIAQCNWFQAIVAFIAYLGFTHMSVTLFPNALNDSIGYLSSMGALMFIALYLNLKHRYSARALLTAALVGVVSLFFRSVDNAVCEVFPVGTHFLWHSLNAVLLYMLMKQLIRNIDRDARLKKAYLRHSKDNMHGAGI
jgi:hypothetical protein